MELPQDFRTALQRHGARLAPGPNNAFVVSDSSAGKPAWQLFELPNREVARATIRLQFSMRPIEGGNAMLALHQAPSAEIAVIARDGAVIKSTPDAVKSVSVQPGEDGWLSIDLLYVNKAPSIVLGLANPGSRYVGKSARQLELRDLRVEIVEPRWTPSAEDRLRIVETGLQTITNPAWQPFAAGLEISSFTPLADQVASLRPGKGVPAPAGLQVTAKALSDRNGTSPFYVTRNKAYSSIFKPDFQQLKGYPSAEDHQILSETRVETCRYDSLVKQGQAVPPDVIRVEFPGLEYNALRGMGDLLDTAMAVETALYLYPVYRKQKLLADIVDLLEGSGLGLFRLVPAKVGTQFGQEVVKMSAIFMRRQRAPASLARYQLLEEIWGLPSSF